MGFAQDDISESRDFEWWMQDAGGLRAAHFASYGQEARYAMFGAMLEKLLTDPAHAFEEDGPNGARISVRAEVKAKAGHEEEIRVILHGLVLPTRAQTGCETYYLLEDKKQPRSFSTYEEWENVASLEKHLNSVEAKAALEKAQPVIDGEMKLTIFRKLM